MKAVYFQPSGRLNSTRPGRGKLAARESAMGMLQGGGVTEHENVRVYVDLIVEDLSSIEIEYPQTSDLFASFAKHRQGPSNFGFAEIGKDDRLREALSKTDEGVALYETLRRRLPLITVSNNILGKATNTSSVKLFELSQLENDPLGVLDSIQKAAGLYINTERYTFLDGLDRLNKILSIKPGFFGVSINVNEVVDLWIKKRRAIATQKIPDRPSSPRE